LFTGIVEQLGRVESVTESARGRRVILTGVGLSTVELGDSIAVNGVCLTAVAISGDSVSVDVIPETLARSNLGEMTVGTSVNIERPMLASGRFDGHIVQGHVDGVGRVIAIDQDSGGTLMTVEPERGLLKYIVEKGSVTVDGVSLTVADTSEEAFSVALIPHTLAVTTLGLQNVGDTVNLEVDVLAKYVERLLKAQQ
jgi:riboflavin synthase